MKFEKRALAALACAVAALGFELPDRGNRREGIVEQRNVSGDLLRIVSVGLEGSAPPGPADERLYLLIPTKDAEVHRVFVEEEESNYLMEPKLGGTEKSESDDCADQPLTPGRWFCWPTAAVINPAGVSVERLRASATNRSKSLFFPILLTARPQRPSEVRYRFVLETRAPLKGRWIVARPERGLLEPVRSHELTEPHPGVFQLRWDGRNGSGKAVPAGRYHLYVEGTIQLRPPRPVTLDVEFMHYGPSAP